MTKISLVSKLVLTALVVAGNIFFATAQTIEYLNSNNIIAGIGIGGNLFSDSIPILPGKSDLFQIKSDSGRAEIYTAALWMHALDEFGSPRGAGEMVGELGKDYFDGPVVSNYDSAYDNYYKRVFKVTQTQISRFKSMTFPVSEAQVDPAILYWPGIKNASVLNNYHVSIDVPLAPFVDINGNGIYEPLLGDYPGICGEQGIFFVYNDIRHPHTECDCNPLGVEIRGMANSFVDSTSSLPYVKRAINNSVFVHYQIENKSSHHYSSFNLGQWLDPDIGCFNNDYVGCDIPRNLMFAYNSVAFDPNCSTELGFGNLPVALGVQLLNEPMDVFGTWGSNTPATSDPSGVCGRYGNYLQGLWADDSPFEYGRDGYYSGGGITKFLFPGDPNDTTQWSQLSAHISLGDKQMYAATNSLSMASDQTINFDIAYTTSFDGNSDYISIVDTVKRDADIVRTFYNNQIIPCQTQFTTNVRDIAPNQLTVSIYPNPAKNEVTIEAGDYIRSIELMDIQGRVLLSKEVNAKKILLPVTNLARGIYLAHVQSANGSVIKRVVVE